MKMLLEHPAAGALTDKRETRRALVNPYPYAIFYQVREDALIVERIRHTSRLPT